MYDVWHNQVKKQENARLITEIHRDVMATLHSAQIRMICIILEDRADRIACKPANSIWIIVCHFVLPALNFALPPESNDALLMTFYPSYFIKSFLRLHLLLMHQFSAVRFLSEDIKTMISVELHYLCDQIIQ